MKGLPLAYNSDMQEDKEAFFDSVDTLEAIGGVLPPMLASLTFRTERMRTAAGENFATATDLADYLVRKGLPFRDGHEIVGKVVRYALERGVTPGAARPRGAPALLRPVRRRRPQALDRRGLAARPLRRRGHRAGRPCGRRSLRLARSSKHDASPAAGRWRWRRSALGAGASAPADARGRRWRPSVGCRMPVIDLEGVAAERRSWS